MNPFFVALRQRFSYYKYMKTNNIKNNKNSDNTFFVRIKKFCKNPKSIAVFWASMYILMVGVLCISAVTIYHNSFVKSIFVSGQSMSPTLLGGKDSIGSSGTAEFGIVDSTSYAKRGIKRFNIVTTYFPWDSSDYHQPYKDGDAPLSTAEFKIKRVIGLPGDLLNLHNGILSIVTASGANLKYDDNDPDHPYPFARKTPFAREINNFTVPLGSYFVMGDNWSMGGSSDSASHGQAIKFDNICGVLMMIQGTCEIARKDGVKTCINHTYYNAPKIPY